MTQRPNFFVVGAAKCGTTSLHHYLSQHPQVFMPKLKELHYFCTDLELGDGWHIEDQETYLRLFEDAVDQKALGEASPWYLFSKVTPYAIKEFTPDAKIIIMLRPPAEFINSIHLQFINTDDEDILDLAEALEAEEDRRNGKRIPQYSNWARCLQYRAAATFSEQVERYLSTFGKQNVHIILLEDLVSNIGTTLSSTYEFLAIDDYHNLDVEQKNKTRDLSHLDLAIKRLAYRNPTINRLAHSVPKPILNAYRTFTSRVLKPVRSYKKDEIRATLREEFIREVEKLETLVDRDLSHWNR